MTWHASEGARAPEDTMQYVHHTPAWKHVDNLYPDFGAEPRNLRFGLAMDGINPYKLMKSKHSTWPVLLINYNIAPWLAIKRGHVLLTVIIPGECSTHSFPSKNLVKCNFASKLYNL